MLERVFLVRKKSWLIPCFSTHTAHRLGLHHTIAVSRPTHVDISDLNNPTGKSVVPCVSLLAVILFYNIFRVYLRVIVLTNKMHLCLKLLL